MHNDFNVVLASASPRRQELLKLIFPEFKISVSNVEEIVPETIEAEMVPEFLAKLKTINVAENFQDDLVIGADTCVLNNGEILGKPHSKNEAFDMLKKLSGNVHKVITGCAIIYKGCCTSFSVTTLVEFYELTDAEINAYINTEEPYDKAGSYGIQSNGALFVKEIKGDYYNVVGLPVAQLNRYINKIIKQAEN